MSELFKFLSEYHPFDWEKNSNYWENRQKLNVFLPYERLYTSLNQVEVSVLLEAAKSNGWEALDLSECLLDSLPQESWNLPELKYLSLRGNSLTEFPMNMAKLTGLRILDISDNPVCELPSFIESLNGLEVLILSDTDISDIPEYLEQAENLKILSLSCTPYSTNLTPELLRQPPRDIIRYVKKSRESHNQFLNEAKMVVLGPREAGKSSVIEKITGLKVPNDGELHIETWIFPCGDSMYTLNVWDLCRDDYLDSTHHFFLTQRTLYLLVWDVSRNDPDDLLRLENWLKTIENYGDNSPVLIVGNKCDRNLGRFWKIHEVVDSKYQVCYVSCKDDFNLESLRGQIIKAAVNLPLMRTRWLSNWVSIRLELEKKAESGINCFTFFEYLTLCHNYKVQPDEAGSLLQYLHDLGVILYYYDGSPENQIMENLIILSPTWATNAVHRVLEEGKKNGLLEGRNGNLLFTDLERIWTDQERYPKHRYRQLLHLMVMFRLAVSVRNDTVSSEKWEWLIPSLLVPAPSSSSISKSDTPVLRYRFSGFLPKDFMPKLIVSLYSLIDIDEKSGKRMCWSNVVYLKYDNHIQGRIELSKSIGFQNIDFYIHSDSSGNHFSRDRAELTGVILQKMFEMKEEFAGLIIMPTIPCPCNMCRHRSTAYEEPFCFSYDTVKMAHRQNMKVQCQESQEWISPELLLNGITPIEGGFFSWLCSFFRREIRYGNNVSQREVRNVINFSIGPRTEIRDNTITNSVVAGLNQKDITTLSGAKNQNNV